MLTPQERVARIHENEIYEIRDCDVPLFRGQTRVGLRLRLQQHFADARRDASTAFHQHLREVERANRRDDITIHHLEGYESEYEAIARSPRTLLNERTGSHEAAPLQHKWTEEEAELLGEMSDVEAAKRLDLPLARVRNGRAKLQIEHTS